MSRGRMSIFMPIVFDAGENDEGICGFFSNCNKFIRFFDRVSKNFQKKT